MPKSNKDAKAKGDGAAKGSGSTVKSNKGVKTKKVASKERTAKLKPSKGDKSSKDKSVKGEKSSKEKGGKGEGKDAAGKRKLGLRGAAPWAARHAAKHAAEARARAAEPPLPGSARATIRVPAGAEDIKAKISELHNSLTQIKAFRKNLNKGFWEIGNVLTEVRRRRLYEAKGYGSFESFLEREIDLGKTTSLRLVRVVSTFFKEAAHEYGMDRVFGALNALDGVTENSSMSSLRLDDSRGRLPPAAPSTASLPLKPPGRI